MKHRETIMKTNALTFKPMSPCLRLFIQSLLAEYDAEITIEECLADDAIAGSAAFASSAPPPVDKNYT
jgi:hypothetical protein